MNKWKKYPQNCAGLQMQIVNDKVVNRNRNVVRYQSMYIDFSKFKNTSQNYGKKIQVRSLKRKTLTLHQKSGPNILIRTTHQSLYKKPSANSFQIMLKLWKQRKNNQLNLQKLTKISKIKLQKVKCQLSQQNNQVWKKGLIQIQKNRNLIFQQIENRMPIRTWVKK